MMVNNYDVLLFGDGACSGNPGPGGWGTILRHVASGDERRLSGGLADTTNNRMELMAVIEGLKAIKKKGLKIQVVTDSQYVSKGMTEWLPSWQKHNWRKGPRGRSGQVKNTDLWKQLVALCDEHTVDFQYVRGHSGHAENEECDRLAVEAAARVAL